MTSEPFSSSIVVVPADPKIPSYPPMELSEEEKARFIAMWDNVPPENVVYLSQEEYDKFVAKLNNPPVPSDALKKSFADAQVAEGMQKLWEHSDDYIKQLKREVFNNTGVPKHLGDIDPRNTTVV